MKLIEFNWASDNFHVDDNVMVKLSASTNQMEWKKHNKCVFLHKGLREYINHRPHSIWIMQKNCSIYINPFLVIVIAVYSQWALFQDMKHWEFYWYRHIGNLKPWLTNLIPLTNAVSNYNVQMQLKSIPIFTRQSRPHGSLTLQVVFRRK